MRRLWFWVEPTAFTTDASDVSEEQDTQDLSETSGVEDKPGLVARLKSGSETAVGSLKSGKGKVTGAVEAFKEGYKGKHCDSVLHACCQKGGNVACFDRIGDRGCPDGWTEHAGDCDDRRTPKVRFLGKLLSSRVDDERVLSAQAQDRRAAWDAFFSNCTNEAEKYLKRETDDGKTYDVCCHGAPGVPIGGTCDLRQRTSEYDICGKQIQGRVADLYRILKPIVSMAFPGALGTLQTLLGDFSGFLKEHWPRYVDEYQQFDPRVYGADKQIRCIANQKVEEMKDRAEELLEAATGHKLEAEETLAKVKAKFEEVKARVESAGGEEHSKSEVETTGDSGHGHSEEEHTTHGSTAHGHDGQRSEEERRLERQALEESDLPKVVATNELEAAKRQVLEAAKNVAFAKDRVRSAKDFLGAAALKKAGVEESFDAAKSLLDNALAGVAGDSPLAAELRGLKSPEDLKDHVVSIFPQLLKDAIDDGVAQKLEKFPLQVPTQEEVLSMLNADTREEWSRRVSRYGMLTLSQAFLSNFDLNDPPVDQAGLKILLKKVAASLKDQAVQAGFKVAEGLGAAARGSGDLDLGDVGDGDDGGS